MTQFDPAILKEECWSCHVSATAMLARPAQDAHGNNVLPTTNSTTGRWSAGADLRPWAFLRNRTPLSNVAPSSISGTACTPACAVAAGWGPGVARSEARSSLRRPHRGMKTRAPHLASDLGAARSGALALRPSGAAP